MRSILFFVKAPLYKDQPRRHICFAIALGRIFLVVCFRTATCVVSYIAMLARLYIMLSDVDSQVWSALHCKKCVIYT